MGVDDDDGVGTEPVEHLIPQSDETGDQADLFAVIELATGLLVEHDGRGMAYQPDARDLTHTKISSLVR